MILASIVLLFLGQMEPFFFEEDLFADELAEENLSLSLNLFGGSNLQLSSGDTYLINPEHRIYSSFWITPSNIVLETSNDPKYPVRIVNLATGTSVDGRLMTLEEVKQLQKKQAGSYKGKGPETGNPPSDLQSSSLQLSNGDTYFIHPNDQTYISSWTAPFPFQIEQSDDPDYPIRIINLNTGISINARPLTHEETQALQQNTQPSAPQPTKPMTPAQPQKTPKTPTQSTKPVTPTKPKKNPPQPTKPVTPTQPPSPQPTQPTQPITPAAPEKTAPITIPPPRPITPVQPQKTPRTPPQPQKPTQPTKPVTPQPQLQPQPPSQPQKPGKKTPQLIETPSTPSQEIQSPPASPPMTRPPQKPYPSSQSQVGTHQPIIPPPPVPPLEPEPGD